MAGIPNFIDPAGMEPINSPPKARIPNPLRAAKTKGMVDMFNTGVKAGQVSPLKSLLGGAGKIASAASIPLTAATMLKPFADATADQSVASGQGIPTSIATQTQPSGTTPGWIPAGKPLMTGSISNVPQTSTGMPQMHRMGIHSTPGSLNLPPAVAPPAPIAPPMEPMGPLAPPPVVTVKAPTIDPWSAPSYDNRAETAINKQMEEMKSLADQGRASRSGLADRLGNIDISGKSAAYLGGGLINSELGLLNNNAESFNTQAGQVASALPSVNAAIQEGNSLPKAYQLQKAKSMFEDASPKTAAEIEQYKAHANYFNSERTKNAPLETIAKLQQESLASLKPEERQKYGLATLPNHEPKDKSFKVDWNTLDMATPENIQAQIIAAHNSGDIASATALAQYLKTKKK